MIIPRTTLAIANRQSLVNLEKIRQRRQRATDEISTGLRLRRPSDGPAEASGVVRTHSALDKLAQFRNMLQAVSDQLRTADTVIGQAVDLVTRARVLASQGANFSQTAATRAGIATEIDGLIGNLITIANTELGGKFLFAGLPDETLPFVPEPASPDGVVYRGDSGRRLVALPGGTRTAASIDGRTIFLNAERFVGTGRTAGSAGAVTPDPPVGLGITFTGSLNATLFADLPSFFVAAGPPAVPAAGDQITVTFNATDGSANGAIIATLAGGESTAQIAAALNAQLALDPALAGKFTFSDQGGNLKLVESDTVGVGFTFSSSASGGLVTGLESGGTVGGLSAEEMAAALNAQVASNPTLSAAGLRFTASGGEIEIDSDVSVQFTAVDFPRGTGFLSGLAGDHAAGGEASANIFRALNDLRAALGSNDLPGIQASIEVLARAGAHLSNMQGFYGATQNQILTAIDAVNQFELVDRERLSSFQDADLVQAISDLNQAEVNEQAALRTAARQTGQSLFDFLA